MPPVYTTGAYRWFCVVSCKSYVGGAYKDFEGRRVEHLRALRIGRHFNKHLQRAWDKYGEASFEFEILGRCSPDEVKELEQYWLDGLQAYRSDCGYNICPNAESRLGATYEMSETHKANLAASCRRRLESLTDAQRAERSRKAKEHGQSPAMRAKVSAARKGKKLSAEHVEKVASQKRGKPRNPEAVRKTAEALRGRKRSPETVAKVKASRLASDGYKHSEASKARIREAMNRPEVKERCRQAALNRGVNATSASQRNLGVGQELGDAAGNEPSLWMD